MAYIGAEPLPGQNREVDDISSGFNGNATAFTLQVSSVNVSPESANNILVNLGGVIQNPGTDYTIAASTITFTTAPAAGLSFFGLILGAGINTATVADDTIGASKLIDTAVTAGSYTTADITVDAQGRITAAASGTISGAEIADQAVTNAKVNNSAAIDVSKLSGVMPLAGGIFTGDVTFDGATAGNDIVFDRSENALEFADSAELRFGTGDDMKIYHDGANSLQFFDSMVGDVRFRTNVTAGARSNIILGTGVDLYHSNSKKFETTAAGATLSGNLSIDANVIHNGDTDTMLSFSAANQVDINCGGAVMGRFTTDGLALGDNKRLDIFDASGDRSGMINNSDSGANSLRIAADPDNSGSGSSIQFHVDGSEQARIANGISFNGDTATANFLNDYEEGTWTPTLGATTSDPTVSSYSFQVGKYTKIGNVVNLFMFIDISAGNITAAGTGDGVIRGLPFTIEATTGDQNGAAMINNAQLPNSFSTGRNDIRFFFQAGDDKIRIHQYNSGNPQVQTGLGASQIANGNRFKVGFVAVYRTSQ